MNKIFGVRIRDKGKVYDIDSGHFVLKKGDRVIIFTEEGPEIACVCTNARSGTELEHSKRQIRKISHMATKEEIERHEKNIATEENVYRFCCELIEKKAISMSPVSVERRFDGSKILVYFTADGRVDFREIVKEMGARFRTRIEMRQIGVRHQAKMVEGLGICGRPLCCASFLNDFAPVTIKMAKEQNISLNPAKISGMCGRLMCCLNFEYENYEAIKKNLPRIGKKVTTKEGEGKVTRQNILNESVTVVLESGNEIDVPVQDLIHEGFFRKKQKGVTSRKIEQ